MFTNLNKVQTKICGFNHIILQTVIYACTDWFWPADGSITSQPVSSKFELFTSGFSSSMAEDDNPY